VKHSIDTHSEAAVAVDYYKNFFSANAEYNITFDLHFAPMRKYQQLFSTNDKVPEINQ